MLDEIARSGALKDAVLFAGFADKKESLRAFERGEHPPLQVLWGKEEILAHCAEASFFNYFGLLLPVRELDVSTAEDLVRKIVARLGFYEAA